MRRRHRVCVPGNGAGVACPGVDTDEEACGSLPCPKEHCPEGFEFSVGYINYFLQFDFFKFCHHPRADSTDMFMLTKATAMSKDESFPC